MNLKLTVNNKNEANIMIIILIIGLLDSLENGLISIDESQDYLFTPYTVSILSEKGIDKQIIEIIEHACELEDIESLLPDWLEDKIKTLKADAQKQLKNIRQDEKTYEVKKWLDEE